MVKTIVKLILIYFGIQIGVMIPIVLVVSIAALTAGEPIEAIGITSMSVSLFISSILMAYYLYKRRYFDLDKRTWSLNSPVKILLLSLALILSYNIVSDLLFTYIPLPDLFKDLFMDMSVDFFGILAIVIVGPILEELLFRGAIMRLLMRKLSPTKAILWSALIFGVIHGNPVQVVNAFFIGLVLGWLYYKTGSLLPAIFIHIVNNGVSTYMATYYPNVDSMRELVGVPTYWYYALFGTIVFALCLWGIKKMKAVDWPKEEEKELVSLTLEENK